MIKVGDKFPLNCGSIATVVKYANAREVYIKTDTGYEDIVVADRLRKGKIADKLKIAVYNVGFIGVGKYNSGNFSYRRWKNIFDRCYIGNNESYKDCYVCEEWHNYQNFAKWFEENSIDKYQIDKDYKCYGNKMYSKENCIFLPSEINNLFCIVTDNGLPHGVRNCNNKYSSSVNIKTVNTIAEAQNNYWNEKYKKVLDICKLYPEFKTLILNYFENFFNDKYTIQENKKCR